MLKRIRLLDLRLNPDYKINSDLKKQEFFFLNPHSFVQSRTNKDYHAALYSAKNIYIDGILILLFVKIFNLFNKVQKIKRITGFDFTHNYLKSIYNKNILFLGSTNDVLLKIKQKLLFINPTLNFFSYSPKFVNNPHDLNIKKIINFINKNKIHTIFIGMTSPKQEILSNAIYKRSKVKLIICIGAVFDYIAVSRGFFFFTMKKIGLEWLYRFIINPKKMYPRIFFSNFFFLNIIFYEKILNIKNKFYDLTVTKNYNFILKKKEFILSAFNLAYYSYLFKNDLMHSSKVYLWPDGIFSRFFLNNVKKVPGRILIKNLKLNKNFKRIHLIGNASQNIENFLTKKYSLKLKFSELPFGNIETIIKHLPIVRKSDLIIINIPTPKQEILAQFLNKKYKELKIICIGGGLAIASGDEKECPKFIEKIYLEFLWRLQYQTYRRSLRLLESLFLLFISAKLLFFKRLKIKYA